MERLLNGLHQFRSEIFLSHQELFERLVKGQTPDALFITCSDSRINPNLLTQTNPGELFILRNAGNIIPPYGAVQGGEAATIEFAVVALGIKDIIVCGHSHCGAVKGLISPGKLDEMPAVASWLQYAEATRRIVKENYKGLNDTQLASVATQENVLVQLEHLRTHPAVAARIARNELNLHGWVYKIETGEVFSYQPEDAQFKLITEASPAAERRKPRMAQTPAI
jgi:carbonic anhydrase